MLSLKNGIRPKKRGGRGNNGIRFVSFEFEKRFQEFFPTRVRSNFEKRERERLGAINISLHFERDSVRDFISRNTV